MTESPLTPERWRTIETILLAAWEAPAGERDLLLLQRCAGDEALLGELRGLLAADEAAKVWEASEEASRQLLSQGPSQAGRRTGPFELERLIGRGGMGAVYLAHRADGQFEQKVAVKLIGLRFEIEPFRERFRRERQILAGLNHPNITRLLDGGVTEDGDLFLAMEYVDGIPLDEYCRGAGRSIAERLRLFRQICAAVQYAHQNLIIHRDIKPSNILVTADGTPKLLDFGTAKLMAEADATQTGMGMMSISYASPEQLRGEPVSTLTDVFSLGAVLYEILTGAKLFGGDLAARILASAAPALPATLDADLRQILEKALAFEVTQRYPSVEQLSEDVRRYIDGEPVLAHPPGFLYRAGKFVRRHPWNVGLTAMFVAGMTAAVFFSMHQATLAKHQATRAQHISTFLTELFGAPNPGWANKLKSRGKNVTVLEVLNEQRNRLGKDFVQDPDVEVELRRAIAVMYSGVGEHDAAREQLARALDRQNADRHADRFVSAKLYVARSGENSLTGRFQESLADGRMALDLLAGRDAPADRDFQWQAYGLVAGGYYGLGKLREAEQPALEALRLSRAVHGEHGPTGITLGLLATIYYLGARLDEAERFALESWSIYMSEGNERPAEAFAPAQVLGAICMDKEDYACAKKYLDEAAKIAAAGFGPDSGYGLSIRGQQALLLGMTGHTAEARREVIAYRQALLKFVGPDSFYVLQADAGRGRVELAAGNFAEAKLYLGRAFEGMQKKLAKDDVRTLMVESRLGECLAAEGKREEGLMLLRHSHEVLLAKFGAGHLYTRMTAARLAKATGGP